ncbi:MAG: hypothetical protein IAE97_14310 [Chthoniobacterales bacterium]|nr:hypothetical protein [Chthoniobacterales bacterium]
MSPRVIILLSVLMSCVATPSPAEEAAFRFAGVEFFQRGDEAGIREFLPAGETFAHWNRLISLRHFPKLQDPRAYALKVVAAAEASDPAAKGQVFKNDDDDVYVADFLAFSPRDKEPQFAEWNLWRITKKDGGLEALQYARRFYDFSEESVAEIKASRNRLIKELGDFVMAP